MFINRIKILDSNNINFYNIIKKIINFDKNKNLIKLDNYIKNIIYNLNIFKEKSIKFYKEKFEKHLFNKINDLKINEKELEKEFNKLDNETKYMLEVSKNRIELFHNEQKNNLINNWKIKEENGLLSGQKINNIERIGLYIPGGNNIYPSSVLMNVIPAKISGVENITVCFPGKKTNNIILATLFLCGIKKVYSIGGIQAIISMGYGNKIISKVDKICGPGNIYVTLSKKYIYGMSGIDMLAGPSEITIISDNKSDVNKIVMDIFSQSEHDKISQSILICDDKNFINKVVEKIKIFLPFLYKKNIVYNSILNNIIIIKVNNLNESFNLLNYISPEHLIISIDNSYEFFKNIKNSGSNFIGNKTSESFGDYSSGLNHIIPTNKNCRFSSPLGVYSFYKNLNYLKFNDMSVNKLYKTTLNFSNKENLYSHHESLKKIIIN